MRNLLHYYEYLLRFDKRPSAPNMDNTIALCNILKTMQLSRKYIHETFSNLDFRNVPLNGYRFSANGKSSSFEHCILNESNFLTGHTKPITHIALSEDESMLVSYGEDHNFVIWDIKSCLQIKKIYCQELEYVREIDFNSKNLEIHAYCSEGIYTLNIETEKIVKKNLFFTDYRVLFYSPSKNLFLIVICNKENKNTSAVEYFYIYNTKSKKTVSLEGTRNIGRSYSWFLEFKYLLGVFSDNDKYFSMAIQENLYIWNTDNGKMVCPPLKYHQSEITALTFKKDCNYIISADIEGNIFICNVNTLNSFKIGMVEQGIADISISDNNQYCIYKFDTKISVLSLNNYKPINYKPIIEFDIQTQLSSNAHISNAFFNNSEYFLSALGETGIGIWSLKSKNLIKTLGGFIFSTAIVTSYPKNYCIIKFMPHRMERYSVDDGMLWDINKQRVIGKIHKQEHILCFSIDGDMFLSIEKHTFDDYLFWGECILRIYQSSNNKILQEYKFVDSRVTADFLFMMDGCFIPYTKTFIVGFSDMCFIVGKLGNKILKFIQCENSDFLTISISDNERFIAYSTFEEGLNIIDLQNTDISDSITIKSEYSSSDMCVLKINDTGERCLFYNFSKKAIELWNIKDHIFIKEQDFHDNVCDYFGTTTGFRACDFPTPIVRGENMVELYPIPNLHLKDCRFSDCQFEDESVKKILSQHNAIINNPKPDT